MEVDKAAGIGCSDVGSTFALDHTSQFTTTEIFKSRKDLIEWVSRVGRSNGFNIVTLNSDVGKGNRRATITLGCERSGKYGRRTPKKGKKKNCGRPQGKKKCGCPFKLKGRKLETNDDWELKVVEGIHNHAAWYSKADISVSSRLPSEDKLRGRDVFKDDISESGSEMQSLMIKLSKYNYIEQHRSCPQTKTILDFFLTHLSSFKLLRAFARVLEVECISKQEGSHDGAILMIFGRTSTDIPFFVGIVFLSSNQKESYVWALRTLQGLMVTSGNTMPDIIVLITTEVALMEAVEVVFSRTKLLLCAWAFPSFVEFAYEEVFDLKEELDYFLKRLDVLISSPTAANFELQLLQLHNDFSRYPAVLEYVTHTWLNPHKEKLVAAWTNVFMHFGVANSLRENTKLQEILGNLIENLTVPVKNQILKLEESFEEIHAGLELQETKINASLESCLTVNADELRLPEFKELCGAISVTALHLVLQQMMLVNIVDGDLCHCAIRNTHGLPCAHELAKYKKGDRPIPLDCIDPYWMKLDTKPLGKNVECGVEESMKLHKLFMEMDTSDPSSPPLPKIGGSAQCNTPTVHFKEERQSEVYHMPLKYVGTCPAVLTPYIVDIKDVAADGHCGFRAIASLLGNTDEDGWMTVRRDLMEELELKSAQYAQLYRLESLGKRVIELSKSLDCFDRVCYDTNHWMTMPEMGHIIATRYNVVLMHLSSVQSLTFLPLRTLPSSFSSLREISVGFVNGHFVQVHLKPGHPMPPIARDWERYHEHERTFPEEWSTLYSARLDHFKALQPEAYSKVDKEVIKID